MNMNIQYVRSLSIQEVIFQRANTLVGSECLVLQEVCDLLISVYILEC